MFRAVFVEHRRLDRAACIALATGLGMERQCLASDIDRPQIGECVTAIAEEAHRRGVFGVPTFSVGDEMRWGNDRLPLVEHRLWRQPEQRGGMATGADGLIGQSAVNRGEKERACTQDAESRSGC